MHNANRQSGGYVAHWSADQTFLGTGDIDGDGDDDVLWRHSSSSFVYAWTMHDGDRQYVTNLGSVTLDLDNVAVMDVDGDGDDDILFRGSSSSSKAGSTTIWEMENGLRNSINPLGSWFGNMNLQTVGDFDGDGDEEGYFRHADGSGSTYIKEFDINAYGSHFSLGNTFVGETIVAD